MTAPDPATTTRHDLADLIYTTINTERWQPTTDGTGNIASHVAADAILDAGYAPPLPKMTTAKYLDGMLNEW